MKSIAYCRVSTENQKEEGTIELQVDAIKEYCQQNEYHLIKIFKDEGISGSRELQLRKGLVDLIDFLEKHNEIQAVVIFKLDRLARDLVVQEQIIKQLNKRKISILSTKEPDLNGYDPTRKFIRHILGATSEFEKSIITMRMSAGRLKKAKNGGYAGGRLAFGYRKKTHKNQVLKSNLSEIQIESKNANVIRIIFEKRNNNYGLRSIADYLNNNHFPSPAGGKWYASTINYIIRNPIYKGTLKYRDISCSKEDLIIQA